MFQGTGKTRTLVAAVEEIVKSSNSCILICANSNAASDEIAMRLLKVLKRQQIFRMYAKSYNEGKISEEIKKSCNFMKDEFMYPCLNYLYKYRVVISTLQTSGHIMRARSDPHFDPRHFSYIIIDECASTHETAALIPIAGTHRILPKFAFSNYLILHILIETIQILFINNCYFRFVFFRK